MLALEPLAQQFQVGTIKSQLVTRHLEELSQAFIKPEGQIWHDRMDITVRDLVPQILGDPVAPLGIDCEFRVGFDEKRPTLGEVWIIDLHETIKTVRVFKKINMDWLVRGGQCQTSVQVTAQSDDFF